MADGYKALRHGAAWLDLAARGRLIARGRDRARLLHNVTSNEVKKMTPGDTCYAFALTPQGRIVADLFLLCRADHFLIDTEPELRDKVSAQILRYRVADQVELEDATEGTSSIGVEGPEAPALESRVPAGLDLAHISETGQPGFRIYAAAGEKAEIVRVLEEAGAVAATAKEARTVRLENGRPRYGEDILETSLPQETGQMHAVSFTKGCYIGQEIVERIRARGHVNRLLTRLELDGPEPPAPGKQAIGGREVEVTSAVYSPEMGKVVVLGYLRS